MLERGARKGKQRAKFINMPLLLALWRGIGSGSSRAGRELIILPFYR